MIKFSPGTLVSSTNKTECHDIAEMLSKVGLNSIKTNQSSNRVEIILYQEDL